MGFAHSPEDQNVRTPSPPARRSRSCADRRHRRSSFALLVLPTALEGTEVVDVGVWLLVFLAFGVISLAVWWILARADKRAEAAEAEKERVDA